MAFTVEQAINEGRRRAKADTTQIRYPIQEVFLKAHSATLKSEINVVTYNKLINAWLASGR
jgi:hypothetical protein